jgi:hypothetical protein
MSDDGRSSPHRGERDAESDSCLHDVYLTGSMMNRVNVDVGSNGRSVRAFGLGGIKVTPSSP